MARKQTRRSQISCVALLACLLIAPLWAQTGKSATSAVSVVEKEIKQTRSALDSIKIELEKGRAKFKELQSDEGNYLSRLEQIEKNISTSGRYVELTQRQIDTTEKTIALLGDSLTKAEVDLNNARELMKLRLRNAYMAGETSKLQMLLSAKSPTEFVRRVRYYQDLNRYDRRLAESIKESIVYVNDKKTSHERNKANLERLFADKKKEQQALISEEGERRAVLEEIRTKKDAYAAMVAELEESQRELDVIIKALESRRKRAKEEDERKAAVSFEKIKGKLMWPVTGEVLTKYGKVIHPVYKTVIMNNGIDIAAQKGARVLCVSAGSVVLVDRMRGLGRFVIVTHGGGFMTLYAHLDDVAVKPNQNVSLGAEIGKVGESGTAGGSKLHFEIRKPPELFDPEEWLEK